MSFNDSEPEMPFEPTWEHDAYLSDSDMGDPDLPFIPPDGYDQLGETYSDAYSDTGIVRDVGHEPELAAQFDIPGAVEVTKMTSYEERAAAKRQKIFEQVGHLHDESNLNIEQIGHYLQALGLATGTRDRLIIADGGVEELTEALRENYNPEYKHKGNAGEYFPDLGLAVTYRSTMNPWQIEGAVTHEDTHASVGVVVPERPRTLRGLRVALFAGSVPPRPGFYETLGGAFWRESFARWVDAGYLLSRAAPRAEKYDNGSAGGSYDWGAKGLDVLFHADPSLIDLSIAAQTDQDAMREFKAGVDGIRKGLFGRLMMIEIGTDERVAKNIDTTRADFKMAQDEILSATGIDWCHVRGISSGGAGTQWVQRKLDAYTQATGYQFKA